MTEKQKGPEYYKSIGFRCGLEIHQRLATKRKLFCSCTADGTTEPAEFSIERRQRAVAGETGKVDASTEFESGKQRHFVYNTVRLGSCLVDVDEEPPHMMDMEALESAMRVCAALHAEMPDEIQPMRKEVVDGSDPSAFQRTMLVGYNGSIVVGGEKIGIPSISLEEESSGIVESDNSKAVYDVGRLGIPLIEIDTDSWISTPGHAAGIARYIGLLLRVCCTVQRGIGSIRQDVNVSITGGARVEIKGVQDLDSMEELIDNEILRQQALMQIKKELVDRNAKVHEYERLTGLFKGTGVKVLKDAANGDGEVYGFRLEGFAGLVGRELLPGRRLGTEISEYVRSSGVSGIIHSDEDMAKYGFSEAELDGIAKELGVGKKDAFIIIGAGTLESAMHAARAARHRAERAIIGVPAETRAADARTATSRFMRMLAGGSRMYPETDSFPIGVDAGWYKEVSDRVPSLEAEKERLYMEIGNQQIAEQMLVSQKLDSYKRLVNETKAEPLMVATTLLDRMTELRRSGVDVDSVGEDAIRRILSLYAEGRITKAAIAELFKPVPHTDGDVDAAVKRLGLERLSGDRLLKVLEEFRGESKATAVKKVMARYRLKVDGDELNRVLGQ